MPESTQPSKSGEVNGKPTYWNGEPTPCSRVVVRVAKAPRSTWWCAALEGQERRAVLVEYGDMTYLLDNEDGSGWFKVTAGRGGPQAYHASLPADSEVLRVDDNNEVPEWPSP